MEGWSSFAGSKKNHIGIGFIDSGFAGGISGQKKTLADALAFTLRKKGFEVTEHEDVVSLLADASLATDRLLSGEEMIRFSGRFKGKYLLQARFDQRRTDELVKEYYQVMLDCTLFDITDGKKIGIVKIFATDLEHVTGVELYTLASLYAGKIAGKDSSSFMQTVFSPFRKD